MMSSRITDEKPRLSLWQLARSIFAAMLGVQSEKNRQRDFSHGKPLHFIVAGLLAALVFVLLIWAVVKLVLSSVGQP